MKIRNSILLTIIATSFISCDYFLCSKEKPIESDIQALSMARTYFRDYSIEFDKCLPLGYINIQSKLVSIKIDTLRINQINDTLEFLGFQNRWLQIYDGKGHWRFQQKRRETRFDTTYIRLIASDL